jgi:hypothetical protein
LQNALLHGVYSRSDVINQESCENFDALGRMYRRDFLPR